MSHYTDAELEIIRQCYESGSNSPAKDAAEKIGRSHQSVRMQARRMGITSPRGWSPVEDEWLCRMYYRQTASELSKSLNRAPNSVWRRAKQLGITRAA